jgi:hypothetical protein
MKKRIQLSKKILVVVVVGGGGGWLGGAMRLLFFRISVFIICLTLIKMPINMKASHDGFISNADPAVGEGVLQGKSSL